ncbi:MAG: HlyC/CorC family transporter [Alphaproteobacteria bacterium]|nr:HlyC/CorC family transporter [Alphaproteobacteria bacterium]
MDHFSIQANPWLALAIVIFCLFLSAIFAAGETALTGASRARMHALEGAGDKEAERVNRLLEVREKLIGALLIGNNVVNIGASAFATSVLVELFGGEGVIYATIAMSILVVIFAEVMPKTIAIAASDRIALALAKPISWFLIILGPLSAAANAIVHVILDLLRLRLDRQEDMISAHEELRGQVDLLHAEGSVERADRDMFGGLLELNDLSVSDVMVHRTKMRTIDADLQQEEIIREVLASPYTRMPMWRNEPENIIGILHAKDLLRALDAPGGPGPGWTVEKIMREAWSLEDILEEIVGDIRDEHDVTVHGLRRLQDGSVIVDGAAPIRDLNRAMDWRLPDDEATTIAGVVIHEARMIPDAGQVFTFHGFRFEILRKLRNRITSLKVTPIAPAKDEEDG